MNMAATEIIAAAGRLARALADIRRERMRQLAEESHAARDDEHIHGELARAAASHALLAVRDLFPADTPNHALYAHRAALLWPFGRQGLPSTTPRQHLVIAAALLAAEIERLDGMAPAAGVARGGRHSMMEWSR